MMKPPPVERKWQRIPNGAEQAWRQTRRANVANPQAAMLAKPVPESKDRQTAQEMTTVPMPSRGKQRRAPVDLQTDEALQADQAASKHFQRRHG